MKALATFFGLSFAALFPVINPVGSALILLGIVGAQPAGVYRKLAKSIAISTTLFLLAVQAAGAVILKVFGISLPVMQLAGGLVLASMGWRMLNQSDPQTTNGARSVQQETRDTSLQDSIFYPLTFPMTAGPACVVVAVTLSAHASRENVMSALVAHGGLALAIVVLSALVYVCYGHAPAITARIRAQTAHGILRVVAFLLMCIGVQIMWNGAEVLVKALLPASGTSIAHP
jgi:multiple antibiotic resistance protein